MPPGLMAQAVVVLLTRLVALLTWMPLAQLALVPQVPQLAPRVHMASAAWA